jgi:hypothetical protein
MKIFFGTISGEQASNNTTANPTTTVRHFWRLANSQAWGGCTTMSTSCPFYLQCIFFVFFVFFV